PDGAAGRPVHAGEDFREGRLAGAVLAEQRVNLARHEVEVDIAQHIDGGEGLADATGGDQRCGSRLGHAGTGASGWIRRCALRSAQKPAGMGAASEATFCVTSSGFAPPGITEATMGWARTNCSAAAGR